MEHEEPSENQLGTLSRMKSKRKFGVAELGDDNPLYTPFGNNSGLPLPISPHRSSMSGDIGDSTFAVPSHPPSMRFSPPALSADLSPSVFSMTADSPPASALTAALSNAPTFPPMELQESDIPSQQVVPIDAASSPAREEELLISNTPETIVPSIMNLFTSIGSITVAAAISKLQSVSKKISEKTASVTTAASSLVASVTEYGDQIIEETKERRVKQEQLKNQQEQKVAKQMIDKALVNLSRVGNETQQVRIDAVLKIVQIETLAELVIDDIMPESVKEIPRLLVVPILDIVCRYDEYFNYTDIASTHDKSITETESKRIGDAYSEFRNKQKIRDMLFQIYGRYNITLNDLIDELFVLYNSNFTLGGFQQQKLSVNGRVRVMKSLYTKVPDTKLADIPSEDPRKPKLPVISVIDYSAIWNKHAKSIEVADAAIAQLRDRVAAVPDPAVDAGVAIPRGHNNRDWDIAGQAAARFAEPMVRVEVEADNGHALDENMGSQPSDFEDDSQDSDAGISPDTAPSGPRFLIQVGNIKRFGIELSEAVETRASDIMEMQSAREQNTTKKQGEMAVIADRRNELANNLISTVDDLARMLKPPDDLRTVEQKARIWDKEVHRIFLQWYRENELLEKQRDALQRRSSSAAASSSKGGKKSHKHHKHHKKQTRKNKKRSTRKLQKKNHKKRSTHTKKH
jgi:hypothetical protein